MRRDTVNYLLVGIFMSVLGVAFMIVMYMVTGKSGPGDDYHLYFRNVSGLKFGTPVFYQGYHVGQIEDVTPEQQDGTRYRVDITVTRKWKIPEDSFGQVETSGLLGRRVIDIKEGETRNYLQPGDMLPTREPADLFAAVNSVAQTFNEISAVAKPFIERLDASISELASELTILTRDDIRPLVKKLDQSYTDPELFSEIKRLVQQLNRSTELVQDLLNDQNRGNLASFLINMNGVSANLNNLISRIELTRVQMDVVLSELGGLAVDNREDIRESIEDLKKILEVTSASIESTVHHLEGSSRNVSEFTRQIRENPSLLLRASPQTNEAEGL
jgi:phospholipid/cholesterol/gamma-HCH transport system substrate-binding protein